MPRSKRMSGRSSWHRLRSRYRYRVVAGLLAVALPITILLGVLLTRSASSSLTTSTRNNGEQVARAVTLRLEDWLSERDENMTVIATQASGRLRDAATGALLTHIDKTYGDFEVIEVTDLNGRILAKSL